MIELTKKECGIILDLIKIAWGAGAVRTEQLAEDLKALKAKLTTHATGGNKEGAA